MTTALRIVGCCIAAGLVLGVTPANAAGPPAHSKEVKVQDTKPLPPLPEFWSPPLYPLVRQLKARQSSLAHGDEAAFSAMQTDGEAVQEWLSKAPPEAWADRRNIHAFAIYLLGGGTPGGGRKSLLDAKLSPEDRKLVDGVIAYSQSRFDGASALLADIDAKSLEPVLGAHIALAQATLLVQKAPTKSFELLSLSATMAPGTLIEEAALRRQIALAAGHSDPATFARTSSVYMKRFSGSVYRRGIVEGVVSALKKRELDSASLLQGFAGGLSDFNAKEQAEILLYLSQTALGQGWLPVAADFARRVVAITPEATPARERANLYASVARMLSDPGEFKAVFATIRTDLLPPSDQLLANSAKQAFEVANQAANESDAPRDTPVSPVLAKARLRIAVADKLMKRT